jgi:hypothetical protein
MAAAVVMDAPALTFDAPTHTYRWGASVVPSVTQILDDTLGDPFAQVPRAILDAAKARGTAVHTACALYDRGELDRYDTPASTMAYVRQWARFRLQWQHPFTLVEEARYHALLGYAGTPDRAGDLPQDWHFLLDLKTGSDAPHVGMQTAGYTTLLGYPPNRTRRYALFLEPERFVLTQCNDHRDFHNFYACLAVFQLKHRKAP